MGRSADMRIERPPEMRKLSRRALLTSLAALLPAAALRPCRAAPPSWPSGTDRDGVAPCGVEDALDPHLPIVDAHHHLWRLTNAELLRLEHIDSPFDHALATVYRNNARYLLDEYLR